MGGPNRSRPGDSNHRSRGSDGELRSRGSDSDYRSRGSDGHHRTDGEAPRRKADPRGNETAPRAESTAPAPPSPPSPRGIIDAASRLREEANRFIADALHERGIDGIVPAHGQLIVPLFHAEGALPLGEIAAAGGRAKSTVTGMAATLEKHGYISRRPCPEDGRSVLAELTSRGKALRPVFEEISLGLMEMLYRDIPEEEQRIAVRVLERAVTNLSTPTR